ncbi:2-deoxy-D-gluconate 3-dehydrogenase [Vibrio variabilis]|uniref:2-deoxy-D-gluconate 3-dehydrogenase n=1 Tax=Vibrio variabilis TaxID=990271 RepID=A0ABQ0J8Y1_9VIBR|nr:2-deoxy-D-gluconate 3-dehydrogenase [Vibrio variabilis]
MILNAFNLEGKVAIVTGCNTGLGQGIAVGLAEAGCNIVAVNRSAPTETESKVTALGRQFLDIRADLMTTQDIPSIVEKTIETFGRIDILVNNAGIIRRADAIEFTEKDWDDVMDVNAKTVFFYLKPLQNNLSHRAKAARSSTSRPCCHSKAGSACLLIPLQKAASWV